jgi:hypothetical protein
MYNWADNNSLKGFYEGFFLVKAGSRIYRAVIVCTVLGFFSTPGTVWAQAYDNPALGQQPVVSHPQDFKPLGIRAGGFMLHPGVELAAEYTDNVFFSYDETVTSDTIFHIRPYITAQSTWSRHSLNVRLAADIGRYADFDFRDYEDYFLLVSGKIDVRNRSGVSYGLDYMRLHEDLNNRDAEQGVQPTVYVQTGGTLGYDHSFNRLSLGLQYSLSRLDFDNVESIEGDIIDNQDRDRDTSTWRFRMGYLFKVDKEAFLAVSSNKVDYKQPLDRNDLHRNSEGFNVDAGVRFTLTELLVGDVFIGYHEQQYDDPSLPDVDGTALGMGLAWYPTRRTSVEARIASSIQQTTIATSSGYFSTLYSLRADHELRRNWQISGRLSYRDNDYQLIEDAPEDARTRDQIWMAGVGVSYFINRLMYLNASYDHTRLKSNIPMDDFEVNRFWLIFGLEH